MKHQEELIKADIMNIGDYKKKKICLFKFESV